MGRAEKGKCGAHSFGHPRVSHKFHLQSLIATTFHPQKHHTRSMPPKRVIPLESNPQIFNELSLKLGLSPVLQFHDVYSLTDPDLLAFLPQPIYGVILLFPLTEKFERIDEIDETTPYANEQVQWFKQTIGNACGLYALLHIVANLPSDFIVNNLVLNELLMSQLSPRPSVAETAKLVEQLELNIQLDENYGVQGQTEAPPSSASVDLHFLAFVDGKDGNLYELDGRRRGPLSLGKSTGTHILNNPKLAERVQYYMDNADEANKNNFALMAVGPSMD